MQAARFHEYGPPDRLAVESVADPAVQPGELLVRVRAAGVNPIDALYRSGALQTARPLVLPFIPGSDFAGFVETDSGPWRRGQAVYGIARGTYAELAVAAPSDVQPLPEGISFETAASAPIGFLTAWKAVEEAGVRAGQRVLVQGAAGGVGLFAAQLARLRGAEVWGTASTANIAFVASLDVHAVDYTRGETAPEPDVVIDAAGGTALAASLSLVRSGGVVISLSGPVPEPVRPDITAVFPRRSPGSELVHLTPLLASESVVTAVRGVRPLTEAAQVHALVEQGHGRGHWILVP